MITHKVTTQLSIDITPEELANMLWKMDDKDQAYFFNRLGEILESNTFSFNSQLSELTSKDYLTENGRKVMALVGEFSKK